MKKTVEIMGKSYQVEEVTEQICPSCGKQAKHESGIWWKCPCGVRFNEVPPMIPELAGYTDLV